MTPPRPILFVSHVARVSGGERSLLGALQHLDRSRFLPLAVLPGEGELAESLAGLSVGCRFLPLRRLRKTFNPLRLSAAAANVAAVAVRLARLIRRERFALVHANSDTAQLYAGPAARLAGVPSVWHTRDLAGLNRLGPWLGRLSSHALAISECVAARTRPFVRRPDGLSVIYNGVDTEEFAPRGEGNRIRNELGLPQEAPVFGMVAQFVPWKNHGAFIEAAALIAAALPKARFVIVGDDLFSEHAAYGAALRVQADRLGLAGRVLFPGFRQDMAAVLDAFDVLIHPADREPLGRVLLEAMAMAKPVVAVNACGPAEIIRDGKDGLLTATSGPAPLAAAALRLAGDPALAARLGVAARRSVEERFDVRATARAIEAVYDQLLRRGGPPCT